MNIHWSGTLQQTWLGRGRAKPKQRRSNDSFVFNYSEPKTEEEKRSEESNSINETSSLYEGEGSMPTNLTLVNASTASSLQLTLSNGGGERGFLRRIPVDLSSSLRHPPAAAAAMDRDRQLLRQKTTPTAVVMSGMRLDASMVVILIAGLFFCFTLLATVALAIFCRKRNTVFVFQKTPDHDDDDYDDESFGAEREEMDGEKEEEEEMDGTQRSGTDNGNSSSSGEEASDHDNDRRSHSNDAASISSRRRRRRSRSHRLKRITEEEQLEEKAQKDINEGRREVEEDEDDDERNEWIPRSSPPHPSPSPPLLHHQKMRRQETVYCFYRSLAHATPHTTQTNDLHDSGDLHDPKDPRDPTVPRDPDDLCDPDDLSGQRPVDGRRWLGVQGGGRGDTAEDGRPVKMRRMKRNTTMRNELRLWKDPTDTNCPTMQHHYHPNSQPQDHTQCHHIECHHTQCHHTQCHHTQCDHTHYHQTQCHHTQCDHTHYHQTQCHHTQCDHTHYHPPHDDQQLRNCRGNEVTATSPVDENLKSNQYENYFDNDDDDCKNDSMYGRSLGSPDTMTSFEVNGNNWMAIEGVVNSVRGNERSSGSLSHHSHHRSTKATSLRTNVEVQSGCKRLQTVSSSML